MSLLKDWRTISLQEDQPVTIDDVPDVEEPYYEIERNLWWCKVKQGRTIFKEYLILWKGYPIEEASWVEAKQFSHPNQLRNYLREDQPNKRSCDK